MSESTRILPQDSKEFTNQQYWNHFFRELNQKAFEWYGSYEQISKYVLGNISTSNRILVLGCGNSNFSNQLYDAGYHNIYNIDYSDLVIKEMKEKNLHKRESMTWEIGDVTNMESLFPKEEDFQIIIDKGTLDAIFSENTAALRQKVKQMFDEVNRLLDGFNGMYVCVSLAQDFILDILMEYFQPSNWEIDVHYMNSTVSSPISSNNSSNSALQPFLFKFIKKPRNVFTRITATSTPSSLYEFVRVFMDHMGNEYALNNPQIISFKNLFSYITHIQEFHLLRHSTRQFEMGRFETLQF